MARDKLVSLGTCIGKFTHSGKFHLTIGALDILAQHAKYKVGFVFLSSCQLCITLPHMHPSSASPSNPSACLRNLRFFMFTAGLPPPA